MKTATIDVGGLLSPLCAQGVEKQLCKMPGVKRADVNFVSGSVTVEHDESVTTLDRIKRCIRDCGYRCSGEMLPEHVCTPGDPPGNAGTAAVVLPNGHSGHKGHARHPHSASLASTKPAKHAGHVAAMPGRGRRAGSAAQPAGTGRGAHAGHAEGMDAMAHEMGHGAGMDMQAMARDMRNRFWVAFAFTLLILPYSPMGLDMKPLVPPFGLGMNQWLFILASGAVLWPSWPFFVAAWRAINNGVLNMATLVVLSVGMRRPESRTEGHPSWWLDLLDGPEEHALMYLKSHGVSARDVMTCKVVTVGENTSLEEIATLLERNRIKRVPVLSGGKLVGIVSRANLLHGLVAAGGKPARRTTSDSRRVRDAVMAELREAGVQTLYMNVVVADGTVRLWGYAESAAERRATALAGRRAPGVRKVENHLAVLTPRLIGSLGAQ